MTSSPLSINYQRHLWTAPYIFVFLQIALLGIILCFFYVPKMAVAIAFLRKNAVEAI